MVRLSAGAVLFFAVMYAASAASPAAYNDLNYRGNVAAQNGQFEEAIVLWKKAIPLDHGPVKKCRGEVQRTDIRAAQDAISMLKQGKLRMPDAPAWFQNHNTELWMPNVCNSN
jgi:hypothetical protein